MTRASALHVNPDLPVDLCIAVAAILARELRELFPTATDEEHAHDLRGMMEQMDVCTAVDIAWGEGWPLAC
jgi:hypothetical protein